MGKSREQSDHLFRSTSLLGAHLADTTLYWNYVLISSSRSSACKVLGDWGCAFHLSVSWLCLARTLGRADAQHRQLNEWVNKHIHSWAYQMRCSGLTRKIFTHLQKHWRYREIHTARSPRPHGWRTIFYFKTFLEGTQNKIKAFLKGRERGDGVRNCNPGK